MSKAIILLIVFVFIESCSSTEDSITRINRVLNMDSSGNLRKDRPKVYSDSSALAYYLRRETTRAGLTSIENGSEAFEIRVWEHLDSGRLVFVFRYKENAWTADKRFYKGFSTNGRDIDSVIVNKVGLGTPREGWDKFMNKLIDKGVLDLKDESEIPGYVTENEFLYIAVEIGAKKYYRYYSLPNARDQASKIKEDRAMLEILNLIENEFRH